MVLPGICGLVSWAIEAEFFFAVCFSGGGGWPTANRFCPSGIRPANLNAFHSPVSKCAILLLRVIYIIIGTIVLYY